MNPIFGQFSDSYFPITDGVANTVRNYAYWLTKKYGETYVIAPEVPDYVDREEFPVIRYTSVEVPQFPPYRMGLPMFDFDFKKSLNNTPFNLIHSHCPFISGYMALKVARIRKIPIITTFHSKYREDFARALKSKILTEASMKLIIRYYNSVDEVWVPSGGTGKTLEEYGFEGPYQVMPNGSDLKIPGDRDYEILRQQGRERINYPMDRPLFLFVGQHRWEKNVKLILQSLAVLKRKGRDFRMVFVGRGYAEEEMRELTQELDLLENVSFLGLILDREELKRIYAASDLFIFPSLYDNVPLVVREAASFKVPAVLVKDSTASEGFRDNFNGFLVENDPLDLAMCLNSLLDNPGLIREAGEGAQKTIYVSWESLVDKVYSRYMEVLRTYQGPQKKRQQLFNDDFFKRFWRLRHETIRADRN